MRIGDTFVINIDKTVPDFIETFSHEEIFPTSEIFNWSFWHEDDEYNYMKVVKAEENHDLLGKKNMYIMQDNF